MADPNSLFIISTFVLGATTLILLLVVMALWFFMKPEGRYFFKQGLGGASLDNLRHEPGSNTLILDSLKWDGQMFINKSGFYYPFIQLLNPNSRSQEIYNRIIGSAVRWKGSKRPVVMTTDLMSFAVSPAFYAAVEKAKNTDKYKKIRYILEDFKAIFDETGVKYGYFIETFNIADIQEIVKDIGPTKVRDAFKRGINREKLKNTKLDGMFGGIPLWAIMLGLVAFVAIVGYILINSGMITA